MTTWGSCSCNLGFSGAFKTLVVLREAVRHVEVIVWQSSSLMCNTSRLSSVKCNFPRFRNTLESDSALCIVVLCKANIW